MSYKVELFNKASLTKIKDIEVVNEPEIYEEINGAYTLDFDAHYSAKNDLTNDVLIKADGQYFKIAKVTKRRDDSISLSVQCEHISYELIVDYEIDVDMEFESDAQTMLTECLQGTRFNLVSSMSTDVRYYNTRTLNIRKRLFEIANLFGGELIFDNFNVHLVQQRGADKGLDITLGVNLIGVTEEKDFVEGTTAYELDLVDLSEVASYELNFTSARIGDTVTIIDNVLGINSNERIIAIRYNPFKRALPTVTVGDYIRDMTVYMKEEEEEEEEETDIKDLFRQFKIGGIDMLKNASDATSDVKSYLTNKYELGVEVSAKYNTLKSELVGIVAEAAIGNKILSVVQTKENADGILVTTITPITSSNQLSTVKINKMEHITLVLSDVPLAQYKANPVQAENANISAIGVCITFDDSDGVFLEKFNIGDFNVLGVEGNDVTEIFEGSIGSTRLPIATSEVEIEKVLRGIEVVPSDEYMDWYLILVHGYENEDGEWSFEAIDLPLSNYADFKVTTNKKDSVMVVVSNESFGDMLDGTTTENFYCKAFGCTFLMGEAPPEETEAGLYFDEFRIGDVDMLPIVSDETEQVKAYINGEIDYVIANATYETTEDLIGLFAQLKEDYAGYHLTLLDYYEYPDGYRDFYNDSYESNVEEYGAHEWEIPDMNLFSSFTLVITDIPFYLLSSSTINDAFIKAFGVKVTKGDGEGGGGDDDIYMEYGMCEISDDMYVRFVGGPYSDVYSVTTGVMTYDVIQELSMPMNAMRTSGTDDVTVFTSLVYDDWGEYIEGVRIRVTNTNVYGVVSIQAICKKGRIENNGPV